MDAGTQLGTYRILSALGKGGMAEVWRALDTELDREVAIKMLPSEFAKDPDRLARFEREAKLLASLNHPNIAAIYGLGESGGTRCLVLELVEGDTLAERLHRGAIPVEESLKLAIQIGAALEAAHEKGVLHRDLKPSNIKVTPEGKVKVLDFGLAKAFGEAAEVNLSNSPTLSLAATNAGVILGTAAYMSPEQAKGLTVDQRTDIFSFGVLLYEMLTGRQAFGGETVTDILARVIEREPDWSRLPKDTPGAIRHLLRRSLQKDRNRRLHTAADARIEIEEAYNDPASKEQSAIPSAVPRNRERLAWISALALVTLIAGILGLFAFRAAPSAPEVRLEIATPPSPTDLLSQAISPDGRKIVFVAASEGISRLWVRSLDAVSAQPLAGTNFASSPFWSPDGRSIGFSADGALKRMDIAGGSAQILTSAPLGNGGGSWNRDGTILFSPDAGRPVFAISATGGEPAPVTRIEPPQQLAHRFPEFLPDGQHFLYYSNGTTEARGVYVGQLGRSETRRLFDADSRAVYASSGYLLFVRQGTLFAQRFDPVRMELSGNPSPVAEHVAFGGGAASFSVSAAGPISYRTGSATTSQQFIWFDRSGKETEKVGGPVADGMSNPSLSPDGLRLALTRGGDIWLHEMARGVFSRFTSDAATENMAIWSPDGRRIVFHSNAKGGFDLYQKPVTAGGSEELLLATPQTEVPSDWSLDGRFLLYRSTDPKTNHDIWVLPMDGDRKPFPVVRTNFQEREAQFSPDGKWIAY